MHSETRPAGKKKSHKRQSTVNPYPANVENMVSSW